MHPTHSPETSPELAAVGVEGHTRSSFLLRTVLATGGILGAGAVSPAVRQAFAQSGDTPSSDEGSDIVVLNFALVLEYLESTFYDRALRQVPGLRGEAKELVEQLRDDEMAHVDTLVETVEKLGGKRAQRPKFDFEAAFADEATFLRTANVLEDTGVSAYNGAAPLLGIRALKAAAGSIVQVEGRHAALVRLLRDEDPSPRPFDVASEQGDVLAAVRKYIEP